MLQLPFVFDYTIRKVKYGVIFYLFFLLLVRWDEAINDFESALRLDKCIPSAHVNIGLLFITKHGNYPRY